MFDQVENQESPLKSNLIGVWTPGEVLFNPILTPLEKLVFGIISNLAQNKRGCWASNRYLAGVFNVSERHIQRCIETLKENKYIKVTFFSKEGMEYETERRIYIDKTFHQRYSAIVQTINDLINKNKIINIKVFQSIFEESRDKEGDVVPPRHICHPPMNYMSPEKENSENKNRLSSSFTNVKEEDLCGASKFSFRQRDNDETDETKTTQSLSKTDYHLA